MVNTKRKMKGGSTELIKHIQDRIAEITRTMRELSAEGRKLAIESYTMKSSKKHKEKIADLQKQYYELNTEKRILNNTLHQLNITKTEE